MFASFVIPFYIYLWPSFYASPWIWALQSLDFAIFAPCVVYNVRTLNFHFCLVIILALGLKYEIGNLNQAMLLMNRKQSNSTRIRIRQFQNSHPCETLARFRLEHARICDLVSHVNSEFISTFFYGFILTNTVFNVSVIMFVLYRKLALFMRLLLLILVCLQISVPASACSVILPVNYALYRSVSRFHGIFCALKTPTLMRMVTGKLSPAMLPGAEIVLTIREQWKSAIYYELVHRKGKKPLIINAGSLGPLNRKALYQVRGKKKKNERKGKVLGFTHSLPLSPSLS